MDSSDGLSTTLNEMSSQSKKKFVITTMPSENDLYDFATLNNLNPNDLILNSGEEYEIVATTNKSNLSKIKNHAKNTELRSMRLVMSQRVWVYFTKKMENWLESKMGDGNIFKNINRNDV